jgi:ABC-type polysaccharide transport system permease subunit
MVFIFCYAPWRRVHRVQEILRYPWCSSSPWVGWTNFEQMSRSSSGRAFRNLDQHACRTYTSFTYPDPSPAVVNENRHSAFKKVLQTVSYLPTSALGPWWATCLQLLSLNTHDNNLVALGGRHRTSWGE